MGHESLGRVRQAPDDSRFAEGDLVVGVVRRPDPEPCPAGGRGEFDMCRNGRYTEYGIKETDGFAAERWTIGADYAVKLDPRLERVGVLMEPASIVAKAWDPIDRIGNRAYFAPERVLVTAVAVVPAIGRARRRTGPAPRSRRRRRTLLAASPTRTQPMSFV